MSEPGVFISYSHDDALWVRKFAEALRDQSVDVWLDTWQLHAGDSLRDALEVGIQHGSQMTSLARS